MKKFNDLVESRTRELSVCSIVPQALRYRVPLSETAYVNKYRFFAGPCRLAEVDGTNVSNRDESQDDPYLERFSLNCPTFN
jgi:hypothetical protein